MKSVIVNNLLDGLMQFPEELHTVCLHGGEPLLVGKNWFREFLEAIEKHPISRTGNLKVGIQTNALLIDSEWADLFVKGGVDVSLSVDGPSRVHDEIRIDKRGLPTLNRVLNSIAILTDRGIVPSAIAVVTRQSTQLGAAAMMDFFRSTPLREIDFTPYIETDSSVDGSEFEATPEELLRFFCELFDQWLEQDQSRLLRIRTFEQTIGAALGLYPTVCNMQIGSGCARIPSILPNGDVFACDLDPAIINVKLGSLHNKTLSELLKPDVVSSLRNEIKSSFRSIGCETCEVAGLCGMTCPRYSFSDRELNGYCSFARQFINHVKSKLDVIANSLFHDSIEFAR